MSSQKFGSEGDIYWNKVYRFDGQGGLPEVAGDILKRHYNLIEENRDLMVFVYQRNPDTAIGE